MRETTVAMSLMITLFLFSACENGSEAMYGSWGKGYVANYEIMAGRKITVIDGRKCKQGRYPVVKELSIADATPPGPFTITVNPRTRKVYVGNYGNDTVSVINANTDEIAKTILDVGTPYGIAVNLNINKIYVSNFGAPEIIIIDGESDTRYSTTIALPSKGACIAVNPNNNKIYIAHPTDGVAGGFTVADLISDSDNIYTTYSNTDAGQFSNSLGIAVNKRTNKVYLANYGNNRVSVIDGTTNHVITHIDGVIRPLRVAVNEKTNKIYVSNNDSSANSVTVINGVKDTVESTITGFSLPRDIVVNERTNIIVVASNGNNTISVIDGQTNDKLITARGFLDPAGIGFIE